MPVPKAPDQKPGKPSPEITPVNERKPWKKKTPVEVVLEQANKLKEEIAAGEEALKAKRRQLEKFEQARKLFEGV